MNSLATIRLNRSSINHGTPPQVECENVDVNYFLLSRIRSVQRESIVIVKKFELEILTNLHVLDLPESEKHNFGIMSVCEHDNSKTIRPTGMKFAGISQVASSNILNDPVHKENLEKTLKNVNLKDVVFSLDNCWSSVSTLLINKLWENLPPNFIDSEVEENVQTEEIQLASLINQLQNTKLMSNTEALQWAAEADDSLARNEILTDDEIIRTVTAGDYDDDDVTP
ncbi:hypothetical protein AVEN_188993-1 [Araneus ventricosus]|uniref:DDE-1 domain-containing protein n=1 Tax=Araneus ventricosus TaxID=182803 RepID=A0A4Y2JK98_ARAVE|nr:hypothetical protein AVEN_188993-1 [Araneus ventricosus]